MGFDTEMQRYVSVPESGFFDLNLVGSSSCGVLAR